MRPLVRLGFAIGLASAAALVSGCSNFSLDPDKLDFSIFDTKQKLAGERKDVFPGGVPGVTPGVPPELMKGYKEQADAPPPAEQKAAEAKPKPAPKPHVVQQPKPQPAQTASVQGTPPAATASAAQAPGNQSPPWPGQPPQQAQPQAQPQASWPAPSPGR